MVLWTLWELQQKLWSVYPLCVSILIRKFIFLIEELSANRAYGYLTYNVSLKFLRKQIKLWTEYINKNWILATARCRKGVIFENFGIAANFFCILVKCSCNPDLISAYGLQNLSSVTNYWSSENIVGLGSISSDGRILFNPQCFRNTCPGTKVNFIFRIKKNV